MDYLEQIAKAESLAINQFKQIDEIALFNQEKVLKSFQSNRLALRHFAPTTGYGYDDTGRDTLNKVFAEIFGSEGAIVSPLIASGTHAIALMFYGILRPGDTVLSICGMPYDTLESVLIGENNGSLKDFGIRFEKVDLLDDGTFDEKNITIAIQTLKPRMVFIQRSRGYNWRNALSIGQIETVIQTVRAVLPQAIVAVDNCYGEFVEKLEPTQVGANIVAGSLIKNPGGGLAPTGGYLAGDAVCVEQIGYRLTAPGVGTEVGSYAGSYQPFYQGLFLAPHVTAQALKGSVLFGTVFANLGYETLPKPNEACGDIIRSIRFQKEDELIAFCRAIQSASPIDSHVMPYPWDMPGYNHQVIMAAGTFVQGASIELSADSPIKEPFIAYLQGGLTYEHVKIALKYTLNKIFG